MSLSKAHTSSDKQHYETPRPFIELVQDRYGLEFILDVASSETNHVCDNYYTKEDDGLNQTWSLFFLSPYRGGPKRAAWCNPPYGEGTVSDWVKVGYNCRNMFNSGYLLPLNKLDQPWYHELVVGHGLTAIVDGRIQYTIDGKAPTYVNDKGRTVKSSNSQGSVMILFGPDIVPGIDTIPWREYRKIPPLRQIPKVFL